MMDSFARNFVANNNWWGNDVYNKDLKPNVTSQIAVDNWLYFDLDVNVESSIATVSINNLYNATTGKTSTYTTSRLPSLYVDINAINASLSANKLRLDGSGEGAVKFDLYGECNITANYGNISVSKKFKTGSFKELQELIDNADNNTVITLDKDYVYTLGVDKSTVGVTINKYNVTVDGNGHFVNGAGKSRVFFVDYSDHITFKNIIITNGNADYMDGAGIYSNCRYCDFINCTFINNTANGNDGGGALYVYSIYSNIVDCTFINNVHDYSVGGAVFWLTLGDADSEFNIKNTIFRDNLANRDGGAIYLYYGGAELTNCTFINNTAGRSGGAIDDQNYNNVTTSIRDCTFIANHALDEDMMNGGGAIFSNNDLIYNCLFDENEAKNGAAIFAVVYSDIDYCMFTNNTAGSGGIIFFEYDNNIMNSIFLNNNVPYGINFIVTPFEGNVADYNWFGNTGNNYASRPDVSNLAEMTKWLFLNATNVVYNEEDNTYQLVYDILVYDSDNKNIVSYGFDNLPLFNLNLSSENLTLSKDVVALGENINAVVTYYKGNLIAEYENVKYTIPFKFQKKSWIEVNSTVEVHITKSLNLDPDIRPFEDDYQPFIRDRIFYTSSNSSIVKVDSKGKITGVSIGVANITIRYNGLDSMGRDRYLPCNTTITVNVTRIPTEIKFVFDAPQYLNVGDTGQIITSLNPYGAGSLTYTSNDTSVATIFPGIIKGIKEGFVNITVSYEGNAKYAPSNVSFIVEVGKQTTHIIVLNDTIEIDKGSIFLIGPSLSPTKSVLFEFISNDTNVAIVDESGRITGVGAGVANITVIYEGDDKLKASSKNVTVTVIEYSTYFDVNSNISVNVTDDAYIGAKLKDYYGNELIVPPIYLHYISNDTDIVGVEDNGRIIGNGLGKANITIIFDGYNKYQPCQANVIVDVLDVATKISVSPIIDLHVGDYTKIDASLNYGNSRELKYESNDTSIVSINSYGYLSAHNVGIAKISITYDGTLKYLPANTTAIINVTHVPTTIDVGKTFSLIVGENQSLNATLNPYASAVLKYSSSDESIVTVDGNGLVTACGEGSAIVTITYAGNYKYAPANQTVNITTYRDFIPTKIEVNSTISLFAGNKTDIGAELIPSNAGKLNYTSNDTTVVTVDEHGIITAIGEGKALITINLERNDARLQENSAEVVVTVLAVPTAIEATTPITVNLTENKTIDYTFSHPEAGEIEFIIANPNIVSVENGVVVGKAIGSTNVTIKFNGNRQYVQSNKTIVVNVVDVSVLIDVADSVSVNLTESVGLGAVLSPDEAGSLVYVSSNESVVVVDADGVITGVGVGEADITVSFEANGKYRANSTKVHVKVTDVEVSIDVADSVSVNLTESVGLGAVLSPDEAGSLVYVSSNESVVVVDADGVITGVGVGEADITVGFEANGKYRANSTKVHVTVTTIETQIKIDNSEISLFIDDDVNINATLIPADAGKLNYISNDTGIVTIDENGQMTAVSLGTAKITISYYGQGKYLSSQRNVTVSVTRIFTEIDFRDVLNMEVGHAYTINPTLLPSRSIGKLTFKSSNESCVEINDNGFISSVSSGTAVIYIKYAGNEKYMPCEHNLTVNVSPRITEIVVDKNISIGYGDSKELGAVLRYMGHNDDTAKLYYSSSDPNIVSVDENGMITANARGSAIITIKYPGQISFYPSNATVNVTVTARVTEISAQDSISMHVDDTSEIKASLSDPDDGILTYSSSNSSVVTVDSNGIVKAIGEGTAVITVSYIGNEDYLSSKKNVTVSVSRIPTSISVNNKFNIMIDETTDLAAVSTPNGGVLSYSSSNSDVAKVDSNGRITGISAGSAMITIRFDGDAKYAPSSNRIVTVNVAKIPTSINADPITIYVGDEYRLKDVISPSDAGKLTYDIDMWTVADVDSSGLITALEEGSATLSISFKGNDRYLPSNTTVGINVIKKTVSSSDYNFEYEIIEELGQAVFKATLPEDMDGSFIVFIDGEAYSETIVDGHATIVVDGITPGDHKISMGYSGNELYASIMQNSEVYLGNLKMDKNSDISVFYTKTATYMVHLTRDTQAMEGKTITFYVNDQTYTAVTDSQGNAYLTLKLPANTYTVTAQYGDLSVTNKITFKHIVVAKNLKAKKSSNLKVKVTLKKINKKYFKGKKIILKFNGKTYKAKTNKKGVATFTIPKKVLSKLKVGKKYRYKVTYAKDTVTKKITIKK